MREYSSSGRHHRQDITHTSGYPCKKGGVEEQKMNRVERQRIMEILMDEAYPFLHERLLKETGVCLEIGKGSLVMLR